VFLDPGQPLAEWTLARWDTGATADGGRAFDALRRAALARPTSAVFGADLATLLAATGRHDPAVLAWQELVAEHPADPRFLDAYAAELVAVGRAPEARTVLDALPVEFAWDPRVAHLRVDVAEAIDGTAGLDPLLEHWQRTDAHAVEPVRRRIDLRVQSRRYDEALELVDALRARAPGPQTDALETALLTAVGRPTDAAAHAPEEVAVRLRARAEGEADPGALYLGMPDDDADTLVARGLGAVWRNAPAAAVALSERAIAAAPLRADVWVARARALEAVGRSAEASDAWQHAWELDPALEGGPVTATRVASTFGYALPEHAGEESPEARGGPKGPAL
jgi:Flp pilus assembly protein TadD